MPHQKNSAFSVISCCFSTNYNVWIKPLKIFLLVYLFKMQLHCTYHVNIVEHLMYGSAGVFLKQYCCFGLSCFVIFKQFNSVSKVNEAFYAID